MHTMLHLSLVSLKAVANSWVSGDQIPSVDKTKTACLAGGSFDLPVATSGKNRVFAIRPGETSKLSSSQEQMS